MASPSFRGDGAYLLQASHQNQGTPYKIFVHIIEARGLISKSATVAHGNAHSPTLALHCRGLDSAAAWVGCAGRVD